LSAAIGFAIGDRLLGADAVDEAMVRAYAQWSKIGRYDCPEAWVYRVAHNWALGCLRKRGGEVGVASPPETGVRDSQPLDPVVWDALEHLSSDQRSVVILRIWLDWSTATTAEALGISQGTVKSRLSRSLESLRNQLNGAIR
jgi:RNA polymerase sigma-70 factor (ECF subfamily)